MFESEYRNIVKLYGNYWKCLLVDWNDIKCIGSYSSDIMVDTFFLNIPSLLNDSKNDEYSTEREFLP